MDLRAEVQPARITRILVGIVVLLSSVSLVVKVAQHELALPHMRALVSMFYVDLESSIPTWYSAMALLFAAVLLGAISYAKYLQRDLYRARWAALACVFLMLSVDEVAMFHELPILPLRAALNARGALYYTWVIPGGVFVLCMAALFARFLIALPRRTCALFVAAAALYVGGAIGVEMLSGYVAYGSGEENLAYVLIVTLEEFMEMLGVVVFIHGLLEYLTSTLTELSITFAGPRNTADLSSAPRRAAN